MKTLLVSNSGQINKANSLQKFGLSVLIRNFRHVVLGYLVSSREPIIHFPQSGKAGFSVYDPYSQKKHYFSSEQEVRRWIDERYYER